MLGNASGAGEHQGIDVHVQRQRLANGVAVAGQHVQHARRDARFHRQRSDTNRSQRGLLRRFEYHRVTGCQCRAQFPAGHQQREVPRHNGRNHTDRLAGHQTQLVVGGRRDFVIHLVDCLGAPADRARCTGNIHRQRIADRLAHVESFQQCQLFAVLFDQVSKALHDALALHRRLARPDTAVEHRTRVGHRLVGIGLIAAGDLRQHATVDRRYAVEGFAADRRLVLASHKRLSLNLQRGRALLPVLPTDCLAHVLLLAAIALKGIEIPATVIQPTGIIQYF